MANNDLSYTLRLKDLFSKTMAGAANQVKGLDSKMSGLKSKMSGMGAMVASAFAVGSVVSFGKAVIASLKNYEYFHASLKVLLNGNAGATKALETQLVNLAATTPFSLTDVQDSTKKLLAYGFKAGEVVETMRTLGDVSAATGNNIGDVAYLYGTLRTQGKAMTKDLYQFTNRGINLLPQLAKQFGVTEDKIYDLASAGKISFKNIESAFQSMTKEGGQFFGMMAEQSKTVGGQLSNMEDSWESLKVNIGKSQTGIINSTINMVSSMISEINKAIAGSNAMDEAFSAKKLQGPTILETIGGVFGNTELRGQRNLVRELTSMSDFANTKNTESAIRTQREFMFSGKMKESKAFTSGKISKEDYDKRLSIYDYFINNLAGGLDVLKSKENKTLSSEGKSLIGGADSTSKSLGTGTEVTGQRPQSLTINITKLVESLNVQTTNLTEGTNKIKEMVSKALLEAVNDANLTAMA